MARSLHCRKQAGSKKREWRKKGHMKDRYEITTQSLSGGDGVPRGPYLLPPDYPVSPFTIYVPNVATSRSDPDQCVIQDNGDFSLSWGSEGNTRVIYARITVQTINMLSDDPGRRAILKQNFALFRQSLENL